MGFDLILTLWNPRKTRPVDIESFLDLILLDGFRFDFGRIVTPCCCHFEFLGILEITESWNIQFEFTLLLQRIIIIEVAYKNYFCEWWY